MDGSCLHLGEYADPQHDPSIPRLWTYQHDRIPIQLELPLPAGRRAETLRWGVAAKHFLHVLESADRQWLRPKQRGTKQLRYPVGIRPITPGPDPHPDC